MDIAATGAKAPLTRSEPSSRSFLTTARFSYIRAICHALTLMAHGLQLSGTKGKYARRSPDDMSAQDTVNCVNLSPIEAPSTAVQVSKEA